MSKAIPAGRMQLLEHAPKPSAALYRLEASIELDQTLCDLVKLRASQVNGCAFWIDTHWKDARAAGEREGRLYSLDGWRAINAWNRLMITARVEPGHYEPRLREAA